MEQERLGPGPQNPRQPKQRLAGSSRGSRALAKRLEFSLDFPLGLWVLGSLGKWNNLPKLLVGEQLQP